MAGPLSGDGLNLNRNRDPLGLTPNKKTLEMRPQTAKLRLSAKGEGRSDFRIKEGDRNKNMRAGSAAAGGRKFER